MKQKVVEKTWQEEFGDWWDSLPEHGNIYPQDVKAFFAQQITTILQEMEGVVGEDEDFDPSYTGMVTGIEADENLYKKVRNEDKAEQRSRLAELKKRWLP